MGRKDGADLSFLHGVGNGFGPKREIEVNGNLSGKDQGEVGQYARQAGRKDHPHPVFPDLRSQFPGQEKSQY